MKVKIYIANNFYKKLMGLMFKKNFNYGLLIPNCKSIHTFNMLENIDVLLLDRNYKILKIKENIPKNKIINFSTKEKETHILELPKGYSKKLRVSEKININNFKV